MGAATKTRYVSPEASKTVYIGLDEFSDDEIDAEYAHRHGANMVAVESLDEYEQIAALQGIRTLLLCGQGNAALDAMREFCRDVLGTAL